MVLPAFRGDVATGDLDAGLVGDVCQAGHVTIAEADAGDVVRALADGEGLRPDAHLQTVAELALVDVESA